MSKSRMIDVGNGLWNIRDSFLALGGFIDIGTHMSLIRLSTGKFLVVDTCAIGDADKALVNEMTQNGALIEAVIATHPFHTLFFEPFYKLYPNSPFYGTARHLAKIKNVPWAGDIADNLTRWESEGIFMRIPAGADFIPSDESIHFSGIFLYHQPSRSLFNDDTILYFDHPGCALRCLGGKRHGDSGFWYVDRGLRTADNAVQFRAFIESVLNDWDFDNLILAHTGNVIGGGKETLRKTLRDAEKEFKKLGAPASGH